MSKRDDLLPNDILSTVSELKHVNNCIISQKHDRDMSIAVQISVSVSQLSQRLLVDIEF